MTSQPEIAESHAETKHFAAIGRIAVAWARFEAEIDHACAVMMDGNYKDIMCLTSQISGSGRKIDAFIAQARLRSIPKEIDSKLETFSKDAQKMAEQRNRIIHDAWYFDHENNPQRYEATARKRLKLTSIPTSTEKLVSTLNHITELSSKFEEIAASIFDYEDASREKHEKDTPG